MELYKIRAKDPDPYNSQMIIERLVVADDVESAIEKFKWGVQYGHSLKILSTSHEGEVIV